MSSTIDILNACSTKLLQIDLRVDKLRSSVSGESPSAPPPTPYTPGALIAEDILVDIMSRVTGTKPKRTPPRCHECHGPVSGYHKEYPHGLNVCELEHYDLCEGFILEGKNRSGHYWRGCPQEYIPPSNSRVVDEEPLEARESLDDSSVESEVSIYQPSRTMTPTNRERIKTRSVQEDLMASKFDNLDLNDGSNESVFPPPAPKNPLGKSKEDLLLEAELAEIEVLKEREQKMELVRKARLEKQKMKDKLEQLSSQEQEQEQRHEHRTEKSLHDVVDNLHTAAARDRQHHRPSIYTGPDMNAIRRDEYTRRRVDTEMDGVTDIPALSNARTETHGRIGVPRVKSSGRGRDDVEDEPVYQRRSQPYRGSQPEHRLEAEEVLYKVVTEYDRYGKQHRTLVEHDVHTPRQRRDEYDVQTPRQRRDEYDHGWSYDHQASRGCRSPTPPRREHIGGNYNQYRHRTTSSPPSRHRDQARTPVRARRAATVDDRAPRVAARDSRSSDEKEGKALSLTDHAKNLPVEFAKSATSKNMNLALWVYGAVSELHGSLLGTSPPIKTVVLEAKLQHIMNVIHVTCLNSNAGEFKPVSWSIGRTYHHLVQAKVDSGREHWSQFESLYRGSPHASEMVSAEREHRAALLKPPATGVKRDEFKRDELRGNKRVCTTWNESEIEGKCKFEAEHPGEKCNRQHTCSYCDKKGFTRNWHQDKFCKRKKDNDK